MSTRNFLEHIGFLALPVLFGVAETEADSLMVGPEFPLDTRKVYDLVPNWQTSVASAFDGTNYFLVWKDNRKILPRRIYGTRVSQEGQVLDPGGIPISSNQTSWLPTSAAVVFGNLVHFVVWTDYLGSRSGCYGARVSPEGTVLDTIPILISAWYGYDYSLPDVGWDGENFLVVWDYRPTYFDSLDIYGCRVSPEGAVLDSPPFRVSSDTTKAHSNPAVVSNGVNSLVAWEVILNHWPDFVRAIYGARVAPDGTVLDTTEIVIAYYSLEMPDTNLREPDVAFDGANYLVTWSRTGQEGCDIWGARVSPDGTVLDTTAILISDGTWDQVLPSVGFDGTNFLVCWEDYRNGPQRRQCDIYGARMKRSGVVLDPGGIAICTSEKGQRKPSVVFGGTEYLVSWTDERGNLRTYDVDGEIYSARVEPDGSVLDPGGFPVSSAANDQVSPAAAFDGTNYLTVWVDSRGGEADIYGARLSSTGPSVDERAFVISDAVGNQVEPQLAFDEENYLVVWEDYRDGDYPYIADIYGARVADSGVLLDTNGIGISTAYGHQGKPWIAFGDSLYLVVWEEILDSWDLGAYACRVTRAGEVLDPDGILISDFGEPGGPMGGVAFDGTNFLVLYWSFSHRDVLGRRVTLSGEVLDSLPIMVSDPEAYSWPWASLSFDGDNYLAVWTDCRSLWHWNDIYGSRVTSEGVVLDTTDIPISALYDVFEEAPSVTFDGSNFVVVWMDYRSGPEWYMYDPDVYAARVSPDGVVLDPDGVPICVDSEDQWFPLISQGPPDQSLVTCTSFRSQFYGSYRAYGVVLSDSVTGVAEMPRQVRFGWSLGLCHPNPFRHSTTIPFSLPDARYQMPDTRHITLAVYDLAGRLVRTLADELKEAGRYQVKWDGTADSGERVSAGVYFYRLAACPGRSRGAGDFSSTRKMVVLR